MMFDDFQLGQCLKGVEFRFNDKLKVFFTHMLT